MLSKNEKHTEKRDEVWRIDDREEFATRRVLGNRSPFSAAIAGQSMGTAAHRGPMTFGSCYRQTVLGSP